jgi:hypothetical protein
VFWLPEYMSYIVIRNTSGFLALNLKKNVVDCVWNVMAHTQKPDFFFRRKFRVHLNRRGRQVIRLLAAQVCASAVVMLDTPCSEVVWRVLATHCIRQFPLYFPSRASPFAIRFQTHSTSGKSVHLQPVNSVEQSPFWKTDSSSSIEGIPCIF